MTDPLLSLSMTLHAAIRVCHASITCRRHAIITLTGTGGSTATAGGFFFADFLFFSLGWALAYLRISSTKVVRISV